MLKNKIIGVSEPKRIGIYLPEDFEFIADYFIRTVQSFKELLQHSQEKATYEKIAKHSFYLWRYMDDMVHFGYPEIFQSLQVRMEEIFGDKDILKKIQAVATKKILASDGQKVIGENSYFVKDGCAHLRSLEGAWHQVRSEEVFLLLPEREGILSDEAAGLEKEYKPTTMDSLWNAWRSATVAPVFDSSVFYFREGVTTPEEYEKHVCVEIETLLENLPALSALQTLSKKDTTNLENLFRVSYKIIRFVEEIRKPSIFPLYILRDGMLFAEAHQALNVLEESHQAYGTVMIGRKLLSTEHDPEYYWRLVVDILFAALKKHPGNFDLFYQEYAHLMQEKEETQPDLRSLFDKLAQYIKEHLQGIKPGQTVLIVDTGLQGSVNMLIKYLIDTRIHSVAVTDIRMFVVGEWFKGIYAGKFASDYYPMMKDIEILARSEYIYNYVPGSFDKGRLQVTMGGRNDQVSGNIELAVLTTLCSLMQKNNLFNN